MQFNYVENGVLLIYELNLIFGVEGEFLIPYKRLCEVLGIREKTHRARPSQLCNTASAGQGKNQMEACWTQETVGSLLEYLASPAIINKTKNPARIRHFKEHFLPFVKHALSPNTPTQAVMDVWETAPVMGEGAWRADAVLLGKTPTQINYEILTGYEEIVTSRMTVVIPGFSKPGAVPVLIQSLGKRLLAVAKHVRGTKMPDSIQTLKVFEMKNPKHALIKRRENFEPEWITTGSEAEGWGRVKNPNRTEVKPWDNEFSLIGVTK